VKAKKKGEKPTKVKIKWEKEVTYSDGSKLLLRITKPAKR
jgi:hypothetical protein